MDHHTRRTRTHGLRRTLAVVGLVVTLGLGVAACAAAKSGVDLPAIINDLSSPSNSSTESAEEGYIPDGESVSIFDEHLPAVANLDPELRAAVQAATEAAGEDGVEMVVSSGWRSVAYQQGLLDDAVVKYGSLEEALKWVSTPEVSSHVTGHAVDIGYTDADSWLQQHGTDYGLCQTYGNEMWHFELAIDPGGTCPTPKSNAVG